MSELYFRLGGMKGFTAIDLADKKEGFANPIRELLQNSLDASRDANKENCTINIYVETISKKDIPHINDYERILQQAINTAINQRSYNENSKQRVRSIQDALKQDQLKVLMFSDDGKGMSHEQIDAILTGGVSIKGDERAGGSFGVGSLSSYSLSSLCYVLYATKYKDGDGAIQSHFTGSPILAGHMDGEAQRGNRGSIVQKKPENEFNPRFDYPTEFPRFIKTKMDKLTTGTVVAILGLSEDWDIEAEYAIASNFFHGIAHDTLKITISTEEQESKLLNLSKIESIIETKKDKKNARGETILSGKATFHALKAVTDGEQKTITLGKSDKVHVYIQPDDKEADPTIALIRNGMLIARHDSMLSRDMEGLRKTSDFKPFTVVIDIDQNAPELLKLVKGAEGPYHNRLKTKILDKGDEKRLRALLGELSEKIKEHLVNIVREGFGLPIFPGPSKAETQAIGGKGSSGQDNKAKKTPRSKSKRKKSEPGDGEGRPKPVVIIRNLQSKKAMRYTDEGDKFKVRLRVIPGEVDAKYDVYLSVCLAEDNDNEKIDNDLGFLSVEINGKPIGIPANQSQDESGQLQKQINLGQLKQAQLYDIIAEVEKPDTIAGVMKVALQPILGLKQRKKTKE